VEGSDAKAATERADETGEGDAMAELVGVDLTVLVDEMTTAMLACGATPAPLDAGPVDREVVGCVHLAGQEWSGSILVVLAEQTARAAAAALFFSAVDAVSQEEVGDVVGEFANVLAGTVKARIGGYCTLSLPSVSSGAQVRMLPPGTVVVETARYRTDLGMLTVSVRAAARGAPDEGSPTLATAGPRGRTSVVSGR